MNTMKEIEPTCSFLSLGSGCTGRMREWVVEMGEDNDDDDNDHNDAGDDDDG